MTWLYDGVYTRIHYDDVIMGAIAAQITSLTIVFSTVYSGADQSKHQSSASLAFVWGIHRGPVNSPHKWPVTRKIFPFHDVIMVAPVMAARQHAPFTPEITQFTKLSRDVITKYHRICLYLGGESTSAQCRSCFLEMSHLNKQKICHGEMPWSYRTCVVWNGLWLCSQH